MSIIEMINKTVKNKFFIKKHEVPAKETYSIKFGNELFYLNDKIGNYTRKKTAWEETYETIAFKNITSKINNVVIVPSIEYANENLDKFEKGSIWIYRDRETDYLYVKYDKDLPFMQIISYVF